MTLKELIEDGLKRHGYDGLFSPDVCACKIGDLAPCGGDMGGCEPGVFTEGPCSNCCGGKLCDFHIGHGIPNATALPPQRSGGSQQQIVGGLLEEQ